MHWTVWVSVPGGQFKPMTGCMKWPGDLTEHPERVTCKRYKALSSFRAAASTSIGDTRRTFGRSGLKLL